MWQSHTRDTGSYSSVKKIPIVLRKPKLRHRVHKILPLFPIRGQMNPFHVSFHLTYLRSILILSSHLRLGGLFSGFTNKTNFFSSPCVLCAQLNLSPWLYHPKYIWWRVKIAKLFIMLFSTSPLPSPSLSNTFSSSVVKVKQSRYRPGVAQRVAGS